MIIDGFVEKRDVTVPLPGAGNERRAVPFDPFDAGSLKAVFNGEATSHQQKRFIEWLIYACGNHEDSFRGESTHASSYLQGRQALGKQIVRMLNFRIPEGNVNAT
jgi:hypothetical protein